MSELRIGAFRNRIDAAMKLKSVVVSSHVIHRLGTRARVEHVRRVKLGMMTAFALRKLHSHYQGQPVLPPEQRRPLRLKLTRHRARQLVVVQRPLAAPRPPIKTPVNKRGIKRSTSAKVSQAIAPTPSRTSDPMSPFRNIAPACPMLPTTRPQRTTVMATNV